MTRNEVLFGLAKRLALPLLAACGGYLWAMYPEQVAAVCNAVR